MLPPGAGEIVFTSWFTYFVIAYFLVSVSFWLYRLQSALYQYDPLFIIPLLQASYIVFATVGGRRMGKVPLLAAPERASCASLGRAVKRRLGRPGRQNRRPGPPAAQPPTRVLDPLLPPHHHTHTQTASADLTSRAFRLPGGGLYFQELQTMAPHQWILFVGGILVMLVGLYLLTPENHPPPDPEPPPDDGGEVRRSPDEVRV